MNMEATTRFFISFDLSSLLPQEVMSSKPSLRGGLGAEAGFGARGLRVSCLGSLVPSGL